MNDLNTLVGRQTELANFLITGWPKLDIPPILPVSAAAAVGNGTQENLCKPVTTGAKDHGSDGIFQWRLERLTNMQTFGTKNFGAWDTIEAQAAFFSYECKGWYKPLWNDLVDGTKSLATLTANICDQYEKPAAASAALDARIKYASDFMTTWKPELHQDDLSKPAILLAPPPASTSDPTPVAAPSAPIWNWIVIKTLATGIIDSDSYEDVYALVRAINREMGVQ